MGKWLAVLVLAMGATGCMAISARTMKGYPTHQVVVANGEVFVVDTRCGAVRSVDVSHAKPLSQCPLPKCDDDDDDDD